LNATRSDAITDTPNSATSSRRRLLGAMLALVACGVASRVHAAALTFDFQVTDGAVPPKMRLVRVKEGDEVTLRFTSDRRLLLHLHGYEIEWSVEPGKVATVTFTATLTGRFPVHAHDTGAGGAHGESVLVEVEVYPR
jgi:hypothetical protein